MFIRLLNAVIAIALSLQTSVVYASSGTPENTVTNMAYKDLSGHKDWNAFLNAAKKRSPAGMYGLIAAKAANLGKTKPPKLTQVSGTTLRFQSKLGSATVQIVDAGMKRFFINNRPVAITEQDTPQAVWDKIEATFPKPAAQGGWLLPSANADFGLSFFIGLGLTIAVMSVVGLVIGFNSCGDLDVHARDCENVAADKNAAPEAMRQAFLNAQIAVREMKPHLGCDGEKTRIENCFKTMQMRTLPRQDHLPAPSDGLK